MSYKEALKNFLKQRGLDPSRLRRRRSRRTDRLTEYRTVTGTYFLPTDAPGDLIAEAIRNNRVFDEPILDVARRYVAPGTTVLDVGSNFGQMAVLLSRMVGSDGVVHAFDADDFVYSILEKNCSRNATNIVTHFGAVHDVAGQTLHFPVQDFRRFDTYGSYGIDYVKGEGRPVKTITIDQIPFEKPVSFMKVDVQGGDLFALRGAVETIRRHQMPIVFEYEYLFEDELKLSFQEYVDFVRSIDYRFEKVIMGQNYLIVPTSSPRT